MVSSSSITISFKIQLVTIVAWMDAHRAFAVEMILRLVNLKLQHHFSCSLHVTTNDAVSYRKSMLPWDETF